MTTPSYQLVQRSLQDIVQAQKCTISHLQNELAAHGDMVSKEEFDSIAQELEVLRKQLKLVQSDNKELKTELKACKEHIASEARDKEVVLQQLQSVRDSSLELEQQVQRLRCELQEEQLARGLEQQDLMEQADKLQFAFGEVASLSACVEKDKSQHDNALSVLKTKLKKEVGKRQVAEKKVKELNTELEVARNQNSRHKAEVTSLQQKVGGLKRQQKANVEEQQLQQQQSHYLSRLMGDSGAASASSLSSSNASFR